MALAEVLVGGSCAVLAGRSALPARRDLSFSNLAQDLALGLSLVVPLAFVWGLAGLPWGAVSMPALALALAAVFQVSHRSLSVGVRATRSKMPLARAGRAALALLGLCLLAALWKWLSAPMWSWDHIGIWGLKARRIVQDGGLDLAFLKPRAIVAAVPSYPLGLPLTWRFLSPSLPSAATFRLCHALFAAGLVAAVFAGARRVGASPAVSALVAAVLCASPLFWDTEAVGLADLPLAFVAAAAVLLILEMQDDPGIPEWTAGAALGFCAWIKTEGAVLGALIVLGALLAGRAPRWTWRSRSSFVAAWLAWSLGALAIRRFLLSSGVGFFDGDWAGRVASRAGNPGPIVGAMFADLTGVEWFGLWFLFAAAALAALVFRRPRARFLGLVVVGQLGFYAFVYSGTYLSPFDHIRTSFHRLAAGLAPLALLAVAAVAGDSIETRSQ